MYCVFCGVELQKGVKACPLCGTKVCHPEIEEQPEALPYPEYRAGSGTVKRLAYMLVLSLLFLIPMVICLLIDLQMDLAISWSGYVIGGELVLYGAFCFPRWFKHPNPVIFFPVSMVVNLLFVLYICMENGGQWFLPFAFPVWGAVFILVECVVVLMRYTVRGVRSRGFLIMGGATIALGAIMLLVEFLIKVTFGHPMCWWSLIPLVCLTIVGAIQLVVGLCQPLRQSLYKKFFL